MRRHKREVYPKLHYYKGRNWRKQNRENSFLKRSLLLVLLPVAWGILELCKHSPKIAETVFATRFYRWISIGYGWLTSKVPFSIAEWIYILGPVFLIVVVVRFVVRMVKAKQSRLTLLGHFLLNAACVVSVLFFLFTILCGVNYYRYSFTYYSNLEVVDSSVEELYALCVDLAEEASGIREQITNTDSRGVFELTTSDYETAKKARDAMEELAKEYPVLGGWSTIPKSVLLSHYMSYTEITGIFFPFTMEANVNTDISDYSIPATMCHELSHLRGFMREDEANFLAYLACSQSDDLELEYSGVMLALIHTGNALYQQDKSLYQQAREAYSDKVLLDLSANSEYWNQFKDTVVSTVSNQVNDTYLKVNHQSDGVKSYGRMVDLLLAYWRAQTNQ